MSSFNQIALQLKPPQVSFLCELALPCTLSGASPLPYDQPAETVFMFQSQSFINRSLKVDEMSITDNAIKLLEVFLIIYPDGAMDVLSPSCHWL